MKRELSSVLSRLLAVSMFAVTCVAEVPAAPDGRSALGASLDYLSLFGGSGDDYGSRVLIDRAGNVILVGETTSPTLPGSARSFQPTRPPGVVGTTDIFIAKFDSTGRRLLWTSYLGGDQHDRVTDVAVDPEGNLFIGGETYSSNFPTTPNAYQGASGRASLSFISKVSADGQTLLASTYVPFTRRLAFALAPGGEVVLGLSGDFSAAFPEFSVAPAGVESLNSRSSSIAVARLDRTFSRMVNSTFVGGGSFPKSGRIVGVCVLPDTSTVIFGVTNSEALAMPANSMQRTYSNVGLQANAPGAVDNGLLMRLSADGRRVLSGTYFGPRFAYTQILRASCRESGAVSFWGWTNAETLPTSANAAYRRPELGFIGRLRPDWAGFEYLSFLPSDHAGVGVLDESSNVLHSGGQGEYARTDLTNGEIVRLKLPIAPQGLAVSASGAVWFGGSFEEGSIAIPSPDAFQSAGGGKTDGVLGQASTFSRGVAAITGAASPESGASCGQLVSLFGSDMGPTTGVAGSVENGQFPKSLAGTRVLVGPNATLAPLLYVGANQVNTAIPFSACGQTAVDLVLERNGTAISTTKLSLAPTAPALFTTGGGSGQAAALNQDGTVNSAANPVTRGEVITLFLTGAGAMTGSPVDGGLAQDASVRVAGTVTALIGSFNTGEVLYGGAAPGLVFGVVQLNVRIPTSAPVGPATAIRIRVGDAMSPAGATIAIQ